MLSPATVIVATVGTVSVAGRQVRISRRETRPSGVSAAVYATRAPPATNSPVRAVAVRVIRSATTVSVPPRAWRIR
ncbi:MAG: hypothetical protein DMD43_05020 [Gemmatimonadetes bacterium]|nr:MAG: hypothetical protein DMD43_05020 [Gemmatimonadota bacterium]